MRKTLLLLLILLSFPSNSQVLKDVIQLSEDLELRQISDHIYLHRSYTDVPIYGRVGANGLVVVSQGEAAILDSPWTNEQTEVLYRWIRDTMHLNVTAFIPNHWHNDCMGGIGYLLGKNVPVYANNMTIDIARKKGLPLPTKGFNDSLGLNLGALELKCYYPGAAHSTDNIAIWIPAEKTLFAGCTVKELHSRNLGNTSDGDLTTYPQTLQYLLDTFKDVSTVIPGHGQPGGIELVNHTMELATQQSENRL